MHVAVISYAGAVGKSTLARRLLTPRLDAELIAFAWADDAGADRTFHVRSFDVMLQELSFARLDGRSCVVDVAGTATDAFVSGLINRHHFHRAFDYYVIPVGPGFGQQQHAMNAIAALHHLGVSPFAIRVMFNRLQPYHRPDAGDFQAIHEFHQATPVFTLSPSWTIKEGGLDRAGLDAAFSTLLQ